MWVGMWVATLLGQFWVLDLLGLQNEADLRAQKLKYYHLKLLIPVVGLSGSQNLHPLAEPNDLKPKIDIKTFNCI